MNRKLFLDAVRAKQTPCNIFGTPTSIVCQDLMKETGVYFPDAHTEAEKMFALALAGHALLGFDVVMPLFSVCHEAAAMGCRVNWGNENMMPQAGKPIFKEPEDIVIPDNLLTHWACKVPLRAISLLKGELGDAAAVCGKVFGSWTQAYHYFGLENFLIMTIENPEKVRQILDRLLPVTIAFANAQIDAGADCILIADHATSDLCSPAAYKQFLLPLHTRLASEIKVPTILHICGSTADRIKYIARTGLDSFHWDTKTGTCEEVRKLAGDKLSLIGGISNYSLLRDTPDDITAQAASAANAGINIIGPECAIPLTAPLENLKAITRIGR
jgi:[methyl-Co(III) methanol-specific corrinoid protein]:coenzyme M methyltransferase